MVDQAMDPACFLIGLNSPQDLDQMVSLQMRMLQKAQRKTRMPRQYQLRRHLETGKTRRHS
ncbi:MAG: hypothetical protein JW955_20425 [Sedimentisphaerales bacterium]|nr:hypothetical protein [Sedimentisphaerales bacterium]